VWEEPIADHDGTAGSTAEALSNAGSAGTPPTVADIADAVWDEALSDHLAAGSTGAGLNAAGSAGDPWATVLPGSYGSGTAGKIVGDNVDAAVSSRAVAGDVMKVSAGTGANQIALASGAVTVGTNNDKSGYTASTVTDKTGYALTSAYDAAKTAAQASVLGAAAGASVAADIAAVKSDTANIGTAGAGLTAIGDTRLAHLDADVSTRLATSGYTAPDNATIASIETAIAALNDVSTADILAMAYEGSESFQDFLRLSRAELYGKANGGGATTMHFRDAADSKNRITAIVDSDGDRSSVTVDAT
jgi:hypothetical protein